MVQHSLQGLNNTQGPPRKKYINKSDKVYSAHIPETRGRFSPLLTVKSTVCKSPFIRKEKKHIHTHILGCHPPSACPAHHPPSQLACLGQGHLMKCLAGVTQPFLSVSTCDRKSCRNLLGNRSPAAPNWELFSPPSSEVVLELLIDASSSHPPVKPVQSSIGLDSRQAGRRQVYWNQYYSV